MLLEMWESTIKEGKTSEALAFFTEWAKKAKKSLPKTNARVLRAEVGDLYRIFLMLEFDSLSAREAYYREFAPKGGQLTEWMKELESCVSGLKHDYYNQMPA